MALNDWKKNVDIPEKLSYENKKNGDEAFITPKDFRYPSGQWTLYIPSRRGFLDSIEAIDYRGKREARKALQAYLRSH